MEAIAHKAEDGYNVMLNGDTLLTGCQIQGNEITFKADIIYGKDIPTVGDTLTVGEVSAVIEGLPEGTVLMDIQDDTIVVLRRHDWDQGTLWAVAGVKGLCNLSELSLTNLRLLYVPGKEQP
ncbi:hypothetical protein NSA19_01040 [Actinomyces bowdenii]|nr:hypothetical protein [Actinomyces bowdenii]